MLFSSLIFLFGFLPAALFVYYIILRHRKTRNTFLTIASLLFYAWGEPKVVLVMLASIILNYFLGLFAHKHTINQNKNAVRIVIAATVILNLLVLVYYKYLDFMIQNLNGFLSSHIPLRHIVLPIGISFFTFQAMSYVFDICRGQGVAQKNPLNVALYISLFPQLIAGPIVRYGTVAEQIRDRKESFSLFADGTKRFIEGLAKKVLLANPLAIVADHAFTTLPYTNLSGSLALLGIIAYTLQIYYDFSGYSDMAIGLGKMFGFKFLENFNFPYIAQSISDFWRRWHISLGTWFRDYVYFPLGGSRVNSSIKLVINLFVVWVLTGIWHGASWNFVAWGLLFFVGITLEKLTGFPDKFHGKFPQYGYQFLTILVIMCGWILFRSPGLRNAADYFSALTGITGNLWYDQSAWILLQEYAVFLVAGILLATPLISMLSAKLRNKLADSHRWLIAVGDTGYLIVLLTFFGMSVSYLVKGSYNPFIYFNF